MIHMSKKSFLFVLFFICITTQPIHAKQTINKNKESISNTNSNKTVEANLLFEKGSKQVQEGSCYFGVADLTKSMELGNSSASNFLGMLYMSGMCVEKDYKIAAKMLKHAYAHGDITAAHIIGIMHSEGLGISKNPEEAFSWYEKAAKKGNPESEYTIGYLYITGEGVKKNEKEGIKWLEKSVEHGDITGQFILGMAYYDGKGVAQDKNKGYLLIKDAADKGNEYAKKKVLEIEITSTKDIFKDEENNLAEEIKSVPPK